MKFKKTPFVLSLGLASFLVVGTTAFAQGSDNNGIGTMMNDNGMMNMMENSQMMNMMKGMNSSEGQKMMNACNDFMKSYQD